MHIIKDSARKERRLYNLFFPIWFILFPPIMIMTLVGNFIVDSLVVIICFYAFKLGKNDKDENQITIKIFYKKTILKVWLFGFLADIIGASILLITNIFGDALGLPDKLSVAINWNPFSDPAAIIIVILAMLVSACFIFIFNNKIALKKTITEKQLKFKVALTIAILTIPWTFLLPTKWFYYGI